MSMEEIFEKTMDEMGDLYPNSPSIIMGVSRLGDTSSDDATYPVVGGARKLDLLSGKPVELAEMTLSLIRSLKRMCMSIAGDEDGAEMFEYVCKKALNMSDEEDNRTVIEEREWSREDKNKIQIDNLTKEWKDFLK